jgi:hypothetical protein
VSLSVLLTIPYIVEQVSMGLLPTGDAATLSPAQCPDHS